MIVFIKIFEPLGNVSVSLLLLPFQQKKDLFSLLIFILKQPEAENQPGKKKKDIIFPP